MASFGKSLVFIGLAVAAVGALFLLSDKVGWIGRLPGDITIRRENFTFHFPLATCILISVIASIVLYLFRK